jgi:PhnB protein
LFARRPHPGTTAVGRPVRLAQEYKNSASGSATMIDMTEENSTTGSAVDPIPAGYHTLTPYLAVPDGAAALDFYRRAFAAEVVSRMDGPGDVLMHAELKNGDSMLQMSPEMPSFGLQAPEPGWVHSSLVAYVPDTDSRTPTRGHRLADTDSLVDRGVAAGASLHTPVANTFSGDRHGVVMDPFGHRWAVCTKIENVPADEVARRARELFFSEAGS